MANTDIRANERNNEPILRQLLQVWRDYYDEIFEVDLQTGAFETLMDHSRGRWPVKGFAGIEVMILAEKLVHPDDKKAFADFFDLEGIARRILDDINVTKLNFRVRDENGEYSWVKVKNIVPTKQPGDEIKFFSCFRRLDDETAADLKYKQELVDALEEQRKLFNEQTRLIKEVTDRVRSPLAGIISMAALAKNDSLDTKASAERFAMIESEAVAMNRALKSLVSGEGELELPVYEFHDKPINEISYGRQFDYDSKPGEESLDDVYVPEGFAFVSGTVRPFSGRYEEIYDFSGKRILLAEGNKLSHEVIRNMLTAMGAEVDSCSDGKSAVIEFISHPAKTYDLVMADTVLDELDGFSVAKCIRISGKEDGETVPIFALTADASATEVKKAYKYRFSALFSRPIDFVSLFDRISKEIAR